MYPSDYRLRMMQRILRRRWARVVAAITCGTLAATTACTRSVKLTRAEYAWVKPEQGPYVMETHEGERIVTDRFEVIEDAFLIEAIINDRAKREVIEPYELAFADIASVKRQDISPGRTLLVMIPLTIAAVYVMLVAAALSGLGGT